MRRLHALPWLAAVVATLIWPEPIRGQGRTRDLAELTLEELLNVSVTTATKSAEQSTKVPAHIEVVTADRIRQRGYRSLTDVLRDLPDFKVDVAVDQDLPTDITVQGIRGSNRIVVLLDGIRISSPTNEPLPIVANYPVHSARQIEVVYGPGSALYGADAFSAVVNIITKTAEEASGLSASASAGQFGLSNVTGTYGASLGRGASLVVSAQGYYDRQPDLSRYYPDDFRGLTGQKTGTFQTIFGPITPVGAVPPAYNIPTSAHSFQAGLQVGATRFSLFQSQSRISDTPADTPDNSVYSDEAFNKNELLVGAISHSRTFGRLTSLSTISMSRHELDPESGYRNVYSNMEKSYKYAFGSRLTADQQVSWKKSAGVTMTVGGVFDHIYSIPQGADLNAPIVSRDRPGTMLGTNIVDPFNKIEYSNLGVYGQGQFALTPAFTLTLGLRFDDSTRYEDAVTPRLGIVWQAAPRTTVKLLHGTAFLAPSPNQAYKHYGAFYSTDGGQTYASSFWHLPNPDLKPERRTTEEVDIRQGVGEHVSVWGSMFYSRFRDLVRYGQDRDDRYTGFFQGWPVDFIEISINDGRQTTWGGSFGAESVQSFSAETRLSSSLSVSLVDGVVKYDDSPIRRQLGGMSPIQLQGAVEFQTGRWSVAPRVVMVGTQRALATGGVVNGVEQRLTLKGYTTVNLNVRRQRLFKGVDAFVTVENALDARYRNLNYRAFSNPEEFVGSPQNPRRLTVGVDLQIR
jgi:outer membrane receptor for ferrienterochelin and colicin